MALAVARPGAVHDVVDDADAVAVGEGAHNGADVVAREVQVKAVAVAKAETNFKPFYTY